MLNNQPNWETLYRDTIYTVSHDLGAPCRHVKAFSELLLKKHDDLDDDSKAMMQHIQQAGIETQAMLNGLLRLSRVYSQTAGFSVVSSVVLAEHFQSLVAPKDSNAHVCVNLKRLDMAAQELANNAAQYGTFVGYRVTTEPKRVSVTALDSGPGIRDDDWETALQPLQRIGEPRTAESVGMGLPIAMAIIGLTGGTLKNTPEGVSIELPIV